MRLKYCPSCRLSGRRVQIACILFPGPHRYFVECPSCHYCGKTRPWEWWAILAWNHERRQK